MPAATGKVPPGQRPAAPGRYREALADFAWLVAHDSSNAKQREEYEKLAERSRQKLKETEGERILAANKAKTNRIGGIAEVSSSAVVSCITILLVQPALSHQSRA